MIDGAMEKSHRHWPGTSANVPQQAGNRAGHYGSPLYVPITRKGMKGAQHCRRWLSRFDPWSGEGIRFYLVSSILERRFIVRTLHPFAIPLAAINRALNI